MELKELSLKFDKPALENLLQKAGIRLEPALSYCCGLYEGARLIACGGYEGATVKCLAVDPEWQGEALLNTVFSHLYTRLRREGAEEVFVFTKPENTPLFRSLGFSVLAGGAVPQTAAQQATAQQAVLLTSDPSAIERWLDGVIADSGKPLPAKQGEIAAIIMNANPFTLGHRYLVEQAAAQCGLLHVFVVQEERSAFPFATRLRLVREGTADLPGVRVHPGGRYIISSATFPSYFLKDPAGAAPAHAALDAELFARRIAPRLGVTLRFVGEEPLDPLTNLYNETLRRVLPAQGIDLRVLPRLEQGGQAISASRVRALLSEGAAEEAAALLPETGRAFLRSEGGARLVRDIFQARELP